MSQSDLERDKTVTRAVHRLFWRAMTQRRGMLALTYLCNLPAFFIYNVFIPLQVAYGMQAILAHDSGRLNFQALFVLVLALGMTTVFSLGTWANHRVNVDGGQYIQRKVFANFLHKDYDFYANNYIGALGGDAVSLRSAFQDYAFMATIDIPRLAIIILAGMVVIMYQSPPLGLASAACVFLVVGVTIYISKFRLKYRRDVSRARSQLTGVIVDPLSQAPAVKSYAQETHEQQRLDEPLSVWRRAELKIYDTSIPSTISRHLLLAVTMATLLIVSARLYDEKAITVAIVVLVQLYVVRIVNSTIEIGELIKQYERIMSDAYEPMATMLVPTTVNDPAFSQNLNARKIGGISFSNVTYAYPEAAKGVTAINDFSLTIKPGEKVGLVGFSGGGKTTITKLLLRFMDVTAGTIRINGLDLRDVSQADLRRAIAYVPQEPLLFHRSIKENIAYAHPEASDHDIKQAAKTAYVDEFVAQLPAGYDAMVGERGVKLSGGQRQRVAIARALLKKSLILVLDEATSALDSQSEQYIQKALWELMKDKTAIVIAHRLSTIQHMDRIIVIDEGHIVQIGSHRQLLRQPDGIYAKLWAHQSGGYIGAETFENQ